MDSPQTATDSASNSRRKTAGSRHTALLVLGMHRSGTSALTRVVNLLGADLGDNLMKAALGNNESGFWEHQGIVDQHDRLLRALGMRWDDPRRLPDGWIMRPETGSCGTAIEEILDQEFRSSALWAVKDPRLCRLLAMWRPLLEARDTDLKVLHMVRHPLEIARSLERRDGMSRGRALLLWLRHQIEAIEASAGLPQVWVTYDHLMTDWKAEMRRVDSALSLGLKLKSRKAAQEIDGFLNRDLRHHALDDEALGADPALNAWVGRLYRTIAEIAGGADVNLLAVSRSIEAEIDQAAYYLDGTFADLAGVERRLRDEIDLRDSRIHERDGRIAERDTRVAERDRALVLRTEQITDMGRVVEALQKTVKAQQEQLDETQAHAENLNHVIHTLRNHIEAIRRSSSWRLTAPVRVVGRIAKRFLSGTHTLTPARLVDLRDRGNGDWEATDIRPTMVLQSNRGRLPRGWVELTYTLKADRVAAPSLLPDEGDGTTEADRKYLPATAGDPVTCYVRLPYSVHALRFDPINWQGRFHLEPIRVRELSRVDLAVTLLVRAVRDEGVKPMLARLRRSGLGGLKEYLARQATRAADNYENWRELFLDLDDRDRTAIGEHIESFSYRPTISIVTPTWETDPALLTRTIESVRSQLYPEWELCIADDGSKKPETIETLKRFAEADPRIKITFRDVNGHISAASNSALKLATGEWIALLDHDDELTEDALYQVVAELQDHPDTDILYSDEDKTDSSNRLSDPYFKPDWSPELFLSQNVINHLGVYRHSLVKEVGGFREGFEGSQDYDLALRILDKSAPERVRHIPAVLYHWRIVEGSVALAGGEKSYAHDRARQAIAEHLERTGVAAEVVAGSDGFSHRVRPTLPDPAPHVTVIVPTRDRVDMLRMAVNGLRRGTDYPALDLIIVDNGSEEPETLDFFDELTVDERIRVLRDDGLFNFSRLNNLAVAEAKGPLVLLLNNDIEPINEDWLSEMVGQLQRPGIGAVGAKLYYPDNTVQHVGVTVGIGGVAGHFEKRLPREANGYFSRPNLIHNATAVTAACLLTTLDLYRAVGGLDEDNLSVAFNDVDFCLKIRETGHRIVVTPYAELYHHESVSRGHEDTPEKRRRFRKETRWMRERWTDRIDIDPYFNPNLHIDHETPSLAMPPRTRKPWSHLRRED